MTIIKAVHNHIIFRFEDPVTASGEFEEAQHKSGLFIHGGFEKSAKSPRWAVALNVGPSCEYVKEGDRILMPALRWTEGVKFQDNRYWKTDETQLVGYVRRDKFIPINDHVTFIKRNETITESSAGLLVITKTPDNTPSGAVIDKAKTCATELSPGTRIYYSGVNFFDSFMYNDIEHSFIKEDGILAYVPEGQ